MSLLCIIYLNPLLLHFNDIINLNGLDWWPSDIDGIVSVPLIMEEQNTCHWQSFIIYKSIMKKKIENQMESMFRRIILRTLVQHSLTFPKLSMV